MPNQPAETAGFSRRAALRAAGCGFGALAFAGLAGRSRAGALAPHHPARAKRIIFVFMQGGVSQVDSFDHKPRLAADDGKMLSFDDARVLANTGSRGGNHRVMKALWKFNRHGQCGHWGSELFPHLNRRVDDLCFIHSMHTEGVAHGPATLFLHTGTTTQIRPSMGAWVQYGLGSESDNLPGFVTIAPSPGNGGARNYGSGFLPAAMQGTALGRAGAPLPREPVRDLKPGAASPQTLNLLEGLLAGQRELHPTDLVIDAVGKSYELAARMQLSAPGLLDLDGETPETERLYGIDKKTTETFGRQCLLARRLVEAGVRFVQVTYGDGSANPAWDQHSNMPEHAKHARAVDQPVAGLLIDLKRRGLLDDTIVWFGSEFGRTPYAQQNGTGRDHNPGGFTVFLAGGGFRPGFSFGATDEFGAQAVDNKVHMHDLHATLLHQLGIHHERLTFRHAGRDFRLTDVHGRVVREVFA